MYRRRPASVETGRAHYACPWGLYAPSFTSTKTSRAKWQGALDSPDQGAYNFTGRQRYRRRG